MIISSVQVAFLHLLLFLMDTMYENSPLIGQHLMMAISQMLFPRRVQSDSTFKQRLQTVLLQHQFAKKEDVSIAQLVTSAVEERQRLFYALQEPSLTGMQRWERSRVSAFNQMLHVHQDLFQHPCHVFTIF